jgi:hypothetical protein
MLAAGLLGNSAATAQGMDPPVSTPPPPPAYSADQLIRMDPASLDQLYQQSAPTALPPGPIRGRVIPYPGTKLAVPSSKVARVIWQGKIIGPNGDTIVNRFFGVRMIRGNVYFAESWMDGRPSLIIDYRETSRLYAKYRDEIRQVSPGLYLGVMYERTCPQPTLKTYFVLEAPLCE